MLVKENLETLDNSHFEGSIDDVIAKLQKIKEKYPGKNLEIVREGSFYDNDYEFRLIYEREETDKEKASRFKHEETMKAKQLKYQMEQYKKLKKMFEGQSDGK